MDEKVQNERKLLLAVAFDAINNTYIVDVAQGSNVAETAFCMAVVIKCLLRDKIIEDKSTVLDLVSKYLSDPLYEEVTDDKGDL